MEPKDIDKLFRERLKDTHPTPPGDLWNRLQQRIDTELPAPQQQEPEERRQEKAVIPLWSNRYYSIAAAVTLLLAVGLAFFHLRHEPVIDNNTIAHQEAVKTETPAEATIAATTELSTPEGSVTTAVEPQNQAAPVTKPAAPARIVAKATPTAAGTKIKQQSAAHQAQQVSMQALASSTPAVEPATPVTDLNALAAQPVTPAVLASAQPVQPVEIVIKRSSVQQATADEAAGEEEEELTSFEKKQRLAKGIFRQARNLTNGEPIDFTDLGINASSIALETQIGKQKISKVINL